MAVLIGNNGTGKNVDSMKDEMSRMKEVMAVLDELIKGEERASAERDEKMASLREYLQTDDSNELSQRYSAYLSEEIDLRTEHGNTLRKYSTMCVKYTRLETELLALVKANLREWADSAPIETELLALVNANLREGTDSAP